MPNVNKPTAINLSVEMAKIALAQATNFHLNKDSADYVADFIEELAKRLSEIDLG